MVYSLLQENTLEYIGRAYQHKKIDKRLASVSLQVESVGNVNVKFLELAWDLHLLLFPWELHSFIS